MSLPRSQHSCWLTLVSFQLLISCIVVDPDLSHKNKSHEHASFIYSAFFTDRQMNKRPP